MSDLSLDDLQVEAKRRGLPLPASREQKVRPTSTPPAQDVSLADLQAEAQRRGLKVSAQQTPTAPAGAPPQAKAPAAPSRQQIDDYRMKYFNTDNEAANIPKATAAALAKDPNNPDTLKRLSRMSPVGQAAIREHSAEMKAENDRTQAYIHSFDNGAPPEALADSLYSLVGSGNPMFHNPVQSMAFQSQRERPDVQPSAIFKGPEGARQGRVSLNNGEGWLAAAANVGADFAGFTATPEGAAFADSLGFIGSLGKAASRAVKAVGIGMGETDAVNRYRKGDKKGAVVSALLPLGLTALHGAAERVSAKAEARKAIANEQAAGNGAVVSGAGSQGLPAVPAGSDIETPQGAGRGSDHPPADTMQGPDAHLAGKVKLKEGATPEQKQEIAAHNAALDAKRKFSIDSEKVNQNVQEVKSGAVELQQGSREGSGGVDKEAGRTTETPKPVLENAEAKPTGSEQPAAGTKLANAHVDAQRAIFDIDPTTSPEDVQNQKDVTERVLSQGLHNDAVRVATEVLKSPRPMTTDELAANALKQHQLKDSLNDIQGQIRERAKTGGDTSDLQTEYDMTREDYKTLTDASRRTGTEQGRGLAFRKHVIDDDSHANITDRMEMKDPNTPLSEEEKAKIDSMSAEVEEKDKAVAEHEKGAPEREEAESKAAVEEAVEKLKPKKTRVGRTPEQRAKVKADILTERADIHTRIQRKLSGLNSVVDAGGVIVKILPEIRDLAGNLVKEGVLKADELVDKVHEHIKQYAPDVTKRQVADAISGYGHASPIPRTTRLADIKEQLRLTSQIEDIHAKVSAPSRTKRPVSPEVQALREQKSQSLADQRGKPRRVGFAQQTVGQRVSNYQKALENKINDYERRIQARDFTGRERNPLPMDDHTRELIKNRDQLKAIYESIKPKTPYDPADTNRLARLTKHFEEIDARHQKQQFGERKPAPRLDTPEEAAMRSKLAAANRQERGMQAARGAYVDPFAKQKAQMTKDIADMERQITAAQPDPHESAVKPRPMDAEGERLKAERKETGRRLNQMIEARKPKTAADKFLSYRRFAALSHLTTLGKLGAAAAKRVFLTSPLESAAGAVTRRLPVLNRIAEKAPEGTPTVKAQLKGWHAAIEKKTFESSMQKLKTSVNHLDLAYGDGKHVEEESLASWAGRLHGAIKTPAQIAEFNKSMSIQEDFYRKQGIDTSDPATQALMAAKAYATSREAILMQDNAVTSAFYEAVNSLERSKNPTARGVAVAAKAAIPIAKVPSNYVGEALLKTPVVGLARLAPLLGRSVDSLTPDEADLVMKVFRKQGVGLAMATVGWLAYDRIGGNYLPHKKPEPGGPEIGAYDTPLGKMSHTYNHSADDAVVMMSADLRRAIEHDSARGENLLTQLGSGAYAAGVGTASDVPFVDVVNKLARAQESSSAFGTMVGEEGTSMVMPGIVPDIAQFLDKDSEGNVRKRKVRGFGDAIKYGIGARSLLEEKR